jgi:hypothetical protein
MSGCGRRFVYQSRPRYARKVGASRVASETPEPGETRFEARRGEYCHIVRRSERVPTSAVAGL